MFRPLTTVISTACLLMLSACTTLTVSPTPALECSKLVHPDLKKPTASAQGPVDDSKVELGTFGIRQTGQLDKANTDKTVVVYTYEECERQNAEALKRAAARVKPWYRPF
jgi:hypothetical protein